MLSFVLTILKVNNGKWEGVRTYVIRYMDYVNGIVNAVNGPKVIKSFK